MRDRTHPKQVTMSDAAFDKMLLHYDDTQGWSLRTPRGVTIYGPSWSKNQVEIYAVVSGIEYEEESSETKNRPVE